MKIIAGYEGEIGHRAGACDIRSLNEGISQALGFPVEAEVVHHLAVAYRLDLSGDTDLAGAHSCTFRAERQTRPLGRAGLLVGDLGRQRAVGQFPALTQRTGTGQTNAFCSAIEAGAGRITGSFYELLRVDDWRFILHRCAVYGILEIGRSHLAWSGFVGAGGFADWRGGVQLEGREIPIRCEGLNGLNEKYSFISIY